MNKRVLKFGAIWLGFVAVAVGLLFLLDYIRYQRSPEYLATQELKELERRYREDPYGGSTPEETLQLFIDALKKGDIELASKYFVLDKQEKWRGDLTLIKERGLLDAMTGDLSRNKFRNEISDSQVTFTITNDENKAALTILLGKGPSNRWKILDL